MSKIAPCLWFDGQAEAAANLYVSVFKDCGQEASLGEVMRYGDAGPGPKGGVLTVEFILAGQDFVALNGGPAFSFSPAISMMVNCADQAEVDRFWDWLLEGGEADRCGWLRDRLGVSWQVVPTGLDKMLRDPDSARADRVMRAMMEMVKLDVAALEAAYDGRSA